MPGEHAPTSSLSAYHKSVLLHQLEYMAYQGWDASVHELYKKIARSERDAYQSFEVLRSVVNGGIACLKKSKEIWDPVVTDVINEVLSDVDHDVNQLIQFCINRDVRPRQLYACILDWSDELAGRAKPAEALHHLARAENLNIGLFPDLYAGLVLKRAEILLKLGRLQDAHRAISVMAERYYLVPDWNLVSSILLLFSRTSLLTGEARHFKGLLFSGLRHFYTSIDNRRLFASLLGKAYRRPWRVLLDRDRSAAEKILFAAHWLDHAVHSSWLGRKSRLDRRTKFGVLAIVYFLNYVIWHRNPLRYAAVVDQPQRSVGTGEKETPSSRDAGRAILVTRAMGGIGDFLTMTPGLHALKEMHPDHEIHLAIPRRYQPIFQGNSDVIVLDIERGDLDIGSYAKWFNFTDCPASRIESRTAPHVKLSRIDIFARALGIRGRRFRTLDRRPRYYLSGEEDEFRLHFWKQHHLDGTTVIGVQLQAAEPYKDYPHLAELVRKLSTEFTVVLFHVRNAEIPSGNRVIDPGLISLRQAFALAASCDAIVAPDSAFVHFAGAFDIPCIALEGPIDGKIGTRYYPACTCVDARSVLKCIPCWRNEYTPCKLTNMRNSVCMAHIAVDEIVRSLKKKLQERARSPRDKRH